MSNIVPAAATGLPNSRRAFLAQLATVPAIGAIGAIGTSAAIGASISADPVYAAIDAIHRAQKTNDDAWDALKRLGEPPSLQVQVTILGDEHAFADEDALEAAIRGWQRFATTIRSLGREGCSTVYRGPSAETVDRYLAWDSETEVASARSIAAKVKARHDSWMAATGYEEAKSRAETCLDMWTDAFNALMEIEPVTMAGAAVQLKFMLDEAYYSDEQLSAIEKPLQRMCSMLARA
jgi:hypothetical protein